MHARRSFHRLTCIATCAAALAGCGAGPDADATDVVARAAAPPRAPSRDADAARGGGLLVDVAGHVRRPGVYRLEPGARVHEAIAAAGGARPGADLTTINRAAPLLDGQQVLVARAGAGGGDAAPTGDGSRTVSINSADAAALDQLPGIGPVTAERIVSEREQSGPFSSIDDLDRVPGVGPATIESLRDLVTT